MFNKLSNIFTGKKPLFGTQGPTIKKTSTREDVVTSTAIKQLGLKKVSSKEATSTRVRRSSIPPAKGEEFSIESFVIVKTDKERVEHGLRVNPGRVMKKVLKEQMDKSNNPEISGKLEELMALTREHNKCTERRKEIGDQLVTKVEELRPHHEKIPVGRLSVLVEMMRHPLQGNRDLFGAGELEIRGKKKYPNKEIERLMKLGEYKLYEEFRKKLYEAIVMNVRGVDSKELNYCIDEIICLGAQTYIFPAWSASIKMQSGLYKPLSGSEKSSVTFKVETPHSGNPRVVVTRKLTRDNVSRKEDENPRAKREVEKLEVSGSYDLITKDIKFEGRFSFGNSGWQKVVGER